MSFYGSLTVEKLKEEKAKVEASYQAFKDKGLSLNMARGVPSTEQLELSNGLLECVSTQEVKLTEEKFDIRNYGCLEGLIEARRLMGSVLGVPAENVIIGGNSSLNLMYDTVARAMLFGVYGSNKPWVKYDKVKFLCPVPGYDRHFGICADLGIEMINVPMNSDGPDMNLVEKLVAEDETIKGIWCVPMYSNPEGVTYSDDVVRRFANLSPAAKDFRIFWDNAYCIHHLADEHDELLNLYDECRKTGKEDMVFIFTSFSKVTFPGAAISALAASKNNIEEIKKHLSMQTIGSDKINQYRHVEYFKTLDKVKEHMLKHRAIIKPKFDAVIEALEAELKPLDLADWTKPKGGYFISVNTLPGCAKRTVQLCKEAGLMLTPAGAPFPYGVDPDDKTIRLAPTFPSVDELKIAISLFCTAVKLASLEKILNQKLAA